MRNTTDEHVFMIFGANDPGSSVRLPDTDNPNVKMYISPKEDHRFTTIKTVKDHVGPDIFKMIDDCLKLG